jgi:3-hydroxybutyryl-CoA dehydratase
MTEYQSREDFAIGEKARLSRRISEADIRCMADLTGDFNPLHMDEDFARQTRFKSRIVHGEFNVGLISAVLGTRLPGPGAVYIKQTLNFLSPIRVGDTLTAEVEVTGWRPDKRIITVATRCYIGDGKDVAAGEAVLLMVDKDDNCPD